MSEKQRLSQLDALRGLACLSVLIHHWIISFPVGESIALQKAYGAVWFSPVHALFSGNEAVLMFFILSGFVLSIPFLKDRTNISTPGFILKRFLRIYPAYWTAITIAFIFRFLVGSSEPIQGLSNWFNSVWSNDLSASFLVNQYALLGSFKNGRTIPVIWSLVHEMRISLFFPLIFSFVAIHNWKQGFFAGASLYALGLLTTYSIRRVTGINQDFTLTLCYIPLFILGSFLAKERNTLKSYWASLSHKKQILLLAIALFSYTYRWWFFPNTRLFHFGGISNTLAVSLGCSIVIMASLGSERITRYLSTSPFLTLGFLSYSIYLYHALFITVGLRLFYGSAPAFLILLFVLSTTLLASWFTYKYIESPFIELGRRVTAKFTV